MRLVELVVNCIKETFHNDDTGITVAHVLDGTLAQNPDYASEMNNVLIGINKAISRLITAGKVPLKHEIITADKDAEVYNLPFTDIRAIRSVFVVKDGKPIYIGWTLMEGNILYLGYGIESTIHILYERKIPSFFESDYESTDDLEEKYGLTDELCNYINYFVKSELFEDVDPDRCKRYLNYFEQFVNEINNRETIPTQAAAYPKYKIQVIIMANKDKFKINLANQQLNKRRTFTTGAFAGVDFQEAETNLAVNNAREMLNIIYKDGVDQTRDAWEQIAKVDGRVNAYIAFKAEDGFMHHIFHIGKFLYEGFRIGKRYSFLEAIFTKISNTELEDYRSLMRVSGKRLYILGGNKYYMLRIAPAYELVEVEDSPYTYIPVTTIGITYKDSPVSGQEALDDVNLMTQWRKNKLVSGTYIDNGVDVRTTRFWQWTLDTSVKPKQLADLNNMEIVISSLRKVSE